MSTGDRDEEHPEDGQTVHRAGEAPRASNQHMPVWRVEAALPAKRDEHSGEACRARKAEALQTPVEEVRANTAGTAGQHKREPHGLNEY